VGNATRRKMSPEKSLDFLSQKSVLRPPVAGPSAETHPSRRQARVRKRTSPVDKSIGRSRVLGVPAELALLHPIENDWHDLGFPCHGCRWKRRVAPFGAACQMEGLERRRRWKRLYCNILNPFNRLRCGLQLLANAFLDPSDRRKAFRRGRRINILHDSPPDPINHVYSLPGKYMSQKYFTYS